MKKILLLVILACAMVSAEPYVHDGFYMSFQYGPGGAMVQSDLFDGGQVKSDFGFSHEFLFKVGGVIEQTVALHGTFFMTTCQSDFNYYGDAKEYQRDFEYKDGFFSIFLGPGITIYPKEQGWMRDVFFSGSMGVASLWSYRDGYNDPGDFSAGGYGFDFAVGKEWWTGKSWTFGLSLAYTFIVADDSDFKNTISWYANSFRLRLSLTRS